MVPTASGIGTSGHAERSLDPSRRARVLGGCSTHNGCTQNWGWRGDDDAWGAALPGVVGGRARIDHRYLSDPADIRALAAGVDADADGGEILGAVASASTSG